MIYDEKDRLLGISDDRGAIGFRRKDLQTEEARVWYDSISGFSEMYKDLNTRTEDPGLDFSLVGKVFIEFTEAPDGDVDSVRRFDHIHVIYTVHNVWNTATKRLLY